MRSSIILLASTARNSSTTAGVPFRGKRCDDVDNDTNIYQLHSNTKQL